MSEWLDPTGRSTFGIGVCARCNQKFSLEDLHPDRNSPGLFVCEADNDLFDPYRLPARQTEDIALRYARPDVSLSGESDVDLTTYYVIGVSPGITDALETETTGLLLEAEGVI